MTNSRRTVALVAVYNEELLVASCIHGLIEQGLSVYLLDHGSTDRTREIASRFLGRGLLEIESVPRGDGIFRLDGHPRAQVELSRSLDAEWFLHADADEIRLPPLGQAVGNL